ncbi:fungal trichothecene efflux pump [Dactylonectria macrodidyma]|uniref:Fungal trichothecene efflux pump n=1 Tax=Dactylonectria macrodidyma TaxID=307937 RepID=A0A9P9IXV2_9HYPO|nr:fungal trichothecene efflux pump [Dactylonectria macrodidyma]
MSSLGYPDWNYPQVATTACHFIFYASIRPVLVVVQLASPPLDNGKETGDVMQVENIDSVNAESGAAEDSGNEAGDFHWDYNVLSNLFSLCIVLFTATWANTIPVSAIPFIALRFPAEASTVSWIATAATTTGAVVLTVVGDISDIFGCRSFLVFGAAIGGVGQIVSGRASFGILATPAIQEMVPKNRRANVTAAIMILNSASFVGTPILEGLFIQKKLGGELEGWRIGFYIGLVLYALEAIVILLFYHPMDCPNPEGLSVTTRLRRLDWIGAFLGCSGISLFPVGMNSGGSQFPWDSSTVLGTIISGAGLLALFIIWEWKGTSNGILPHALWKDRNFTISLIARVVGGFALLGSQAFLPQIVVIIFSTDGLMTAVWQLPSSISSILGAVLAALMLTTLQEVRLIVIILACMLALGVASSLMGLAVGAEAAVLGVISGLTVPHEIIATAISVSTAGTYIGGAIAATMYSRIYSFKIKVLLPAAIAKAALGAGLSQADLTDFLQAYLAGDEAVLATLPGVGATILSIVTKASKNAYAKSFTYIWYALLAWCGLSIVIAMMYTSTKHYFTNEVIAPVQESKGSGAKTSNSK